MTTTSNTLGIGSEAYFKMADRGLEAMRMQGHVRLNVQPYAKAMADEHGQLKQDCFLATDPEWAKAFARRRSALQEIGPHQPADAATVIEHMLKNMTPDSLLALKLYDQAKAYGLEQEIVEPPKRVWSTPKLLAADTVEHPKRTRDYPVTKSAVDIRKEMALKVFDSSLAQVDGSLKPDTFLSSSRWEPVINRARLQFSDELALLRPPSDSSVVHYMIENAIGNGDFREAIIRYGRMNPPEPASTFKAHVTDDREVAARIQGERG